MCPRAQIMCNILCRKSYISLFRTFCSWCHQPRILLAVRRVARGNPPAWLSVAFTAQAHSESLLFLVITHYHSFDVWILTHSLIMYIQCRNSFAIYFSSTCKSIIVGALGVTNSMCYSEERSDNWETYGSKCIKSSPKILRTLNGYRLHYPIDYYIKHIYTTGSPFFHPLLTSITRN